MAVIQAALLGDRRAKESAIRETLDSSAPDAAIRRNYVLIRHAVAAGLD